MNWSTKFPLKGGFYIVSLNNGNVGIAYFTKCLQRTTNSPIEENTWNTSAPVIAFMKIPEHYLDNEIGWNFSFEGENLPKTRGEYLVSVIEQKSYGQIKKVDKLFYEAKEDHWYGLPSEADVIAWRKFPNAYRRNWGHESNVKTI